jgi:diguanylate cyclase (GGDEF)-like protein/PAS domain S-box-containing protein
VISDDPNGLPERLDDEARPPLDAVAFEQLFDHAGGMLAILDAGARFLAVNAACRTVLGVEPETLVGESLLDLVQSRAPSALLGSAEREAPVANRPREMVELLARHRHADGAWRWLLWSGAAHGERWYLAARDVTEWMRLENRVGRDPLTQLPNREIFTEEVTHALARHERSGHRLAVLFVDIDSLKQINDSVGHEAGDRLVAHVAERLRLSVRGGDLVARLGGDEFGILVESLDDELEAATVARRTLATFDEPIELDSGPIHVTASIGVSTAHAAPGGAAVLIHEADTAMYQAKAAGRNRFAIFDAQLRSELEDRVAVEHDLRAAVEDERFTLRYQPIVSLRDGAVAGCEALLRWEHPSRGLLSPAEFVPFAERAGLIVPLGQWALAHATDQAAAWRAAGADLFVSLDVSARELHDVDFTSNIRSALASSGLDPRALCIEIGESTVLADPERVPQRLAELRSLGVLTALDSFGEGSASLRDLSELPLDILKLISAGPHAGSLPRRALLAGVVAAAHELGISVIADGVEHEHELGELIAAGCDCASGGAFSPPLAAGEMTFDRHDLPGQFAPRRSA